MTDDCKKKDVLEEYAERRFEEEADETGLCEFSAEDHCKPLGQRAGEVGKTPAEESKAQQACRQRKQSDKR